MIEEPSNDIGMATGLVSTAVDVDAKAATSRGSLPEHLRAPEGLEQDVHEINVLLTAIILNVNADIRWLNRASPNADQAKITTSRLLAQTQRLQALICKMSEGPGAQDC